MYDKEKYEKSLSHKDCYYRKGLNDEDTLSISQSKNGYAINLALGSNICDYATASSLEEAFDKAEEIYRNYKKWILKK
jgi:hypothetical protein